MKRKANVLPGNNPASIRPETDEFVTQIINDCYLSKKDSARYTGLSADTLDYHSVIIGDLPRIKLEGKILYKKSVLDRWLESYAETRGDFNPEKLADKALSKLRKKFQRAG